jgi:CheY-like chemotaxis protein
MKREASDANRARTVVGVEDNQANLELLRETLTGAGYRFVGFSSGIDMLDELPSLHPALILLDIQMPRLDGFEACRRIRASPNGKTVPIVFLTMRRTPEDVRTGLAAGANDFMVKPISRDRLLERVAKWTSRGPEG